MKYLSANGKVSSSPFTPSRPSALGSAAVSKLAIAALSVGGVTLCNVLPTPAQVVTPNPVIKVGVVQRFGSEPTQTLTLTPATGDRLTLRFKTNDQPQTLTTTAPVQIDIVQQPLPEPQVVERVVLSTHRSFESAEDSANQWRSRGIEVEIAQPRQWQVWAKRDTYSTPLLRRLLMKNLESQGARTAFIDSQTQQEIPRASFVVNGFRYTRDEVDILSGNNRVTVLRGDSADPRVAEKPESRRIYAGTLRLQPNAYGTYTLVNTVPIETYLRGVVPHEIGLQAPDTTIQAQAILARTYALRNLRRFAIDNYQLCADTQCQVYWGLGGADEKSDRAIYATRGLVLTYRNELVDALYSSTTGGITAPFSDVWNGPDRPYLQAVIDSVQNAWDLVNRPLSVEANLRAFINLRQGFNEVGWDTFRWRIESSVAEVTADLRRFLQSKQHPLANFTQVQGLRVTQRSPAGRVQKVEVQTDRGVVTLEKDEILRALSAPNSLLFYVDPLFKTAEAAGDSPDGIAQPETVAIAPDMTGSEGSSDAAPDLKSGMTPPADGGSPAAAPLRGFVFTGGGLGHAVGMSQTGAYNLGRLNWSASRILSFYYPGTRVEMLNPSIVFWRDPAESIQVSQGEAR